MNKKATQAQKLAAVNEIFAVLSDKAVLMARVIMAEQEDIDEMFEGEDDDEYTFIEGEEVVSDGTETITDQDMADEFGEGQPDVVEEKTLRVSKETLPDISDLKTNPALDPKNFPYEIPEEKILEAAKITGGINNYTRLLYTGKLFKDAGMTPIYLCNADESIIRVSATEIWLKPLN